MITHELLPVQSCVLRFPKSLATRATYYDVGHQGFWRIRICKGAVPVSTMVVVQGDHGRGRVGRGQQADLSLFPGVLLPALSQKRKASNTGCAR
ncbi:MAG: hypothetical protein BMS9Abin10_0225 [Gammaproteobacteria bacterium]|nr:MAG: hypothetical protein BMS9Abin10_0225 [Gammaproteobacteria bacterium]